MRYGDCHNHCGDVRNWYQQLQAREGNHLMQLLEQWNYLHWQWHKNWTCHPNVSSLSGQLVNSGTVPQCIKMPLLLCGGLTMASILSSVTFFFPSSLIKLGQLLLSAVFLFCKWVSFNVVSGIFFLFFNQLWFIQSRCSVKQTDLQLFILFFFAFCSFFLS